MTTKYYELEVPKMKSAYDPPSDADMINAERSDFERNEQDHNTAATFSVDYKPVAVLRDELTILQACVFIEDALNYRSIDHKVDQLPLKLYRFYYSKPILWFQYFVITLLLLLAFFEHPSSLSSSWTSDTSVLDNERIQLPCGLIESIELICLVVLSIDAAIKVYFRDNYQYRRNPWVIGYIAILFVSYIDWVVSLSLGCQVFRVRRILRPFFMLQNSSLMKKTIKSLRRTVPEIMSVLILLFVHIYFFALLGMLIFPNVKRIIEESDGNSTDWVKIEKDIHYAGEGEGQSYFPSLQYSLINLLVLLTTANNPDVMMPAFKENRLYAIYFIIFLAIGLYCFMNMLTAIIYNQFRGYFKDSMSSSLFRRRLGMRAAYEVLKHSEYRPLSPTLSPNVSVSSNESVVPNGVHITLVNRVIQNCRITLLMKFILKQDLGKHSNPILNPFQFQDLFDAAESKVKHHDGPVTEMTWTDNPFLRKAQFIISHERFSWIGHVVALINVICISVSVELSTRSSHSEVELGESVMAKVNLGFVAFYIVEQALRTWAFGLREYFRKTSNAIDAFITFLLFIAELLYLIFYDSEVFKNNILAKSLSLWDLVRVVNILIMIRLLKAITLFQAFKLVARTMIDLVRSLNAFAGILVVVYYTFAILGMELLAHKTDFRQLNSTNGSFPCGSYEQLDYFANNFNDFAAALVTLWDIMVVNNWHVFLQVYRKHATEWSQLYFIAWWLVSVIIVLNLFTALILENFVMRWDLYQRQAQTGSDERLTASRVHFSVHEMFRETLTEPSEEELLLELSRHKHLILPGLVVSL